MNTPTDNPDDSVKDLLDRYFREVAVDGLHNNGFSTKSQNRIPMAKAQLKKLLLSKAKNYVLCGGSNCGYSDKEATEDAIPVSEIEKLFKEGK